MEIQFTRPNSLVGIKRLAQRIRKTEHLPHNTALERAARSAGFENYRHAQRSLTATDHANKFVTQGVYITAYWMDINYGRETLHLADLPHWTHLTRNHDLPMFRSLRRFIGEAPDHLVIRQMPNSQDKAIEAICAAARELQFMHATGFRKFSDQMPAIKRQKLVQQLARLPYSDHCSLWYSPGGEPVMVDEPYYPEDDRDIERTQWAKAEGFYLRRIKFSIYQPMAIEHLYLLSRDQQAVDEAAEKLSLYPSGPLSADAWKEPAYPYRPVFVSPLREASGKAAKAPPTDMKRETPTSIPMYANERRPRGKLSIAQHQELANLLKRCRGLAWHRAGMYQRLGKVRSTMDDWVQHEYSPEELSNEVFFNLYYPGKDQQQSGRYLNAVDHRQLGLDLTLACKMLSDNYPDCAPLRKQLHDLAMAQKSLGTWRTLK
jgi:Domain of unknown function (DUF5623)